MALDFRLSAMQLLVILVTGMMVSCASVLLCYGVLYLVECLRAWIQRRHTRRSL